MKKQYLFAESILEEMECLFRKWKYIKSHGTDELSPDGIMLNLIRNKIACCQYKIQQQIMSGVIPPVSLPDLPPEVPNDFIVRYEERMEYVKEFRGKVKSSPIYEEFKDFMNYFKTTSIKKADGVYVPDVFNSLMLLEFQSPSNTAVQCNELCLIQKFGYKNAMQRFEKSYEREKEDIKRMMLLFEELNNKDKGNNLLYDLFLPKGIGVQLGLF